MESPAKILVVALTVKFPQSGEPSQSFAKFSSPSEVVRRIARMLNPSNAR